MLSSKNKALKKYYIIKIGAQEDPQLVYKVENRGNMECKWTDKQ